MTTQNKIQAYLLTCPSYTAALSSLAAHFRLPELVIKAHMSALIRGGIIKPLSDGPEPRWHLTESVVSAASKIQPDLPLQPTP